VVTVPSSDPDATTYVGIDAGGSHTGACVSAHGEELLLHGPSLNPASMGSTGVIQAWTELFARIVALAPSTSIVGWVGAAGVTGPTLAAATDVLRQAAGATGVRGRLALANDLVPLVLGPPLWGHGVVVAAGTGSSVLGRHRSGRTARVGGYEYLLSDEGGGFDIGLRGLRAAARAHDGRGPATELVASARRVYGLAVPELGHRMARAPFPKPAVARFARQVCEAWVAGDGVAGAIVEGAIDELVASAARVASVLGAGVMPCVLTGSIPLGCPPFLDTVSARLRAVGMGPVTPIGSPERVSCSLARSGREPGDSSAEHVHVRWVHLDQPARV
jgi:N-acetylglucosamine kinase-like BadF-type ATPase